MACALMARPVHHVVLVLRPAHSSSELPLLLGEDPAARSGVVVLLAEGPHQSRNNHQECSKVLAGAAAVAGLRPLRSQEVLSGMPEGLAARADIVVVHHRRHIAFA